MRLATITFYGAENDPTGFLPDIGTWRETGGSDDGAALREDQYSATLTDEQAEAFIKDWDLDPADSEPNLGILSEYGWLASDAYDLPGEYWNVGGVMPFMAVHVRLSESFNIAAVAVN